MRIGSLGLFEVLVIAGLIVLLFGASILPRLGRNVGGRVRKSLNLAKWMWNSSMGSDEDSIRAEENYGRDCAREFTAQFVETPPPAAQELAAAVGARLAATVKQPRKFNFRAVAAADANAFALPGGFVFVTAALLDLCESDQDEVAFVLAHEMGHVLRGHAKDRLMVDQILNALTARSALAGQMLGKLVREGYSREQELEADQEAVAITRAAGFNPVGAERALRRLERKAAGDPAYAQYFSSHPPIDERVSELRRAMRA